MTWKMRARSLWRVLRVSDRFLLSIRYRFQVNVKKGRAALLNNRIPMISDKVD